MTEAQLRGGAAEWQPLVERALEHALHVIDALPVARGDMAMRKQRRARSREVDEVLDELDAVKEVAGPGKPLPEADVPSLAARIDEVLALEPGSARVSTLEGLEPALELARAVAEAMTRRGGLVAPRKAAAATTAAASAPAAGPSADDRRRQLADLEAQKARLVQAERYEEAGEVKQRIASLKLQLVERAQDAVDAAGGGGTSLDVEAETRKRYSGQQVVEIFKFVWDQTQQYVRVHVDIPCGIVTEETSCNFDPDKSSDEKQAFALRAKGRDGRLCECNHHCRPQPSVRPGGAS
jgi:hypothetical protein